MTRVSSSDDGLPARAGVEEVVGLEPFAAVPLVAMVVRIIARAPVGKTMGMSDPPGRGSIIMHASAGIPGEGSPPPSPPRRRFCFRSFRRPHGLDALRPVAPNRARRDAPPA